MGGNPATAGIEIIQIASLGDAVDFGDLTQTVAPAGSTGPSNPTRGIRGGGSLDPATSNVIDYINFESAGNAADFGDLSVTRQAVSGSSNGHGGLDVFDPTTRI